LPPSKTVRTRAEIVRRHKRERQVFVFGLLIVVITIVAIAASAVFNARGEKPFNRPFITASSGEFSSDIKWACAPNDTFPMAANQIVVRVSNGTTIAGLAGDASTDLEGRGFLTTRPDNSNNKYVGVARISVGVDGVVQGYTVAAHFEEYELIIDSREGGTVDIVLGDAYRALRPPLAPELDPTKPLAAPARCLPPELVEQEPAPQTLPVTPAPGDGDTGGEGDGSDTGVEESPSPSTDPSTDPSAPPPDQTKITSSLWPLR